MTVVVDVGFFMEVQAYAVTGEVAHNAVAVLLTVFLYRMADVAHEAPGLGGLHANLQTFLGHTHQLLLLRRSLTDNKHARGIGVIAVKDSGEVYVDDVTLFQHILFLGNTVTYHLVNARTDAHGERLHLVVTAIVQAGRRGIVFLTIAAANPIYLQGVHACMDGCCHSIKHTCVHHTGTPYALNLLGRLDQIAGRNKLALVLPVHNLLVKLRWLLSSQAVPAAFLVLCHLFNALC